MTNSLNTLKASSGGGNVFQRGIASCRFLSLFALSLFLTSTLLTAQENITYSTLSGRITDTTGAIVRGAQLRVRSLDTNQEDVRPTDERGSYRFPYLKPGRYIVFVHATGFAAISKAIELTVGGASSLDFRLSVSASMQSVHVDANIEAQQTVIAEVVNTGEIDHLPLKFRDYLNLTLLVPDVSTTALKGSSRFATTTAVPDAGVSISSQRNLNNSYIVDGLSNNDDAAGLPATYFSQEVFDEFQVITSNATAEFGRGSAGFVNLATRAGSNTFHGRAYGFLRNQRMDAENALSGTKLPLTWPQYGASFSGPIVRERTFFFANYERARQSSAGFSTIGTTNTAAINTVLAADNYPGPLVSTGEYPATLKTDTFMVRIDQQVSPRDKLFGRYNLYNLSQINAANNGSTTDISHGTNLFTLDSVIALNNVYAISNRTYNETRAQVFHLPLQAPVVSNTLSVTISGVATFGAATVFPTARLTNGGEFADAVTLERGAHSLKFGTDALYQRIVITQPGNRAGSYSFSSLANFKTGKYTTFTQDFGQPLQGQDSLSVGMFAQDEWRLRPNLTMNVGVRFDIQRLPSIANTNYNEAAPRIGFVWSPYTNNKTVLRASYGIFYGRIPARIFSLALQSGGGAYRTATYTPIQTGAPVFPNIEPLFATGQLQTISTVSTRFPVDSSTQVSLQFEQKFAPKVTGSFGYNHLRGLHLPLVHGVNVPTCTSAVDPVNLCRPNPNFGNINQYEPLGDSWFDGFTTSLLARPQEWFNVRLSYTWSHAIDDTSNAFTSSPEFQNNVLADRGRSDNDQRNRLIFSTMIGTPSGPAHSIWEKLRNGFTLSGVLTYDSPLPFNILYGADEFSNTYTTADRPVGVGRNSGIGFVYRTYDARLTRVFAFGERLRLEGIAEGFNVTNTRNNEAPNGTFGTGTYPTKPAAGFGTATAVGDPRQVELGARVTF